jgi:negative regulator of flagellin synthesis FlgM
MRINDLYRQAATPTDATSARPSGAGSAAGGASIDASAGAPVKVTVSSKALELSSQTSEASDAKVARLTQAVADGSFKVDPQAIANKIVEGD